MIRCANCRSPKLVDRSQIVYADGQPVRPEDKVETYVCLMCGTRFEVDRSLGRCETTVICIESAISVRPGEKIGAFK